MSQKSKMNPREMKDISGRIERFHSQSFTTQTIQAFIQTLFYNKVKYGVRSFTPKEFFVLDVVISQTEHLLNQFDPKKAQEFQFDKRLQLYRVYVRNRGPNFYKKLYFLYNISRKELQELGVVFLCLTHDNKWTIDMLRYYRRSFIKQHYYLQVQCLRSRWYKTFRQGGKIYELSDTELRPELNK